MVGARSGRCRASLSARERRSASTPGSVGDAPMTKKTNLDRLSAMADAANQAGRWKARLNGLLERGAPSAVRSLGHDAQARAQYEAAMQRAMSKAGRRRPAR